MFQIEFQPQSYGLRYLTLPVSDSLLSDVRVSLRQAYRVRKSQTFCDLHAM